MPFITGPGINSFKNLDITAVFELLAGASVLIPSGRIPVFIYTSDPDFDDMDIEIQSADGWEPFYSGISATEWIPIANKMVWIPWGLISDGINYRFRNLGANPIAGIQYVYMEVS